MTNDERSEDVKSKASLVQGLLADTVSKFGLVGDEQHKTRTGELTATKYGAFDPPNLKAFAAPNAMVGDLGKSVFGRTEPLSKLDASLGLLGSASVTKDMAQLGMHDEQLLDFDELMRSWEASLTDRKDSPQWEMVAALGEVTQRIDALAAEVLAARQADDQRDREASRREDQRQRQTLQVAYVAAIVSGVVCAVLTTLLAFLVLR